MLDGIEGVCRGGIVAARIIDVEHLLGFSAGLPSPRNHEQGCTLAILMAQACRQRFQTDYALSVTPWGEIPVDHSQRVISAAWVGLSGANMALSAECRQTGNPAIFASRTAKRALDLLRRYLFNLPCPR